MENSREKILARVRDALKNPAKIRVERAEIRLLFADFADAEAKFCEEFVALGGEIARSRTELDKLLGEKTGDACETDCEFLVAESGSIVVSEKNDERSASALAEIHVVAAKKSRLVRDLDEMLARLREKYGEKMPRFVTVISGPSRTADIEKIIVRGAHGPRRLILLLED
jgi:L-lactate utilization protein LutB